MHACAHARINTTTRTRAYVRMYCTSYMCACTNTQNTCICGELNTRAFCSKPTTLAVFVVEETGEGAREGTEAGTGTEVGILTPVVAEKAVDEAGDVERAVPHSPQKFAPSATFAPHSPQNTMLLLRIKREY